MYRIGLTDEQRTELRQRGRQPGLAPRARERLEMIALADAGWNIPRIARHLAVHEQTVRKYVTAFLAGGFDRLADRPRPGRPRRLTDVHLTALERLLDTTERTWTLPQLVGWLGREHSARVHPDYLRVLLKRRRFRWKRTKRTVRHKGDPDRRAVAELELARLRRRARHRPVVPGPGRLRPDPADRVHLGSRGGAQAGPLRGARAAPRQCGRGAGA